MPYRPHNALLDRPQPAATPIPRPEAFLPPLPPARPSEDDLTDEELDAIFQAFANSGRQPQTLSGAENDPNYRLRREIESTSSGIDYSPATSGLNILANVPREDLRPENLGTPQEASQELARLRAGPGVGVHLMPQNEGEREAMRQARQSSEALATRVIPQVALSFGAGPAMQGAANVGRAIAASPPGRFVAERVVAPAAEFVGRTLGSRTVQTAAAPATVAATTAATTAQTQQPDPLATARTEVAKLRERRAELEKEEARLKRESTMFDGVQQRGTASIQEMQQLLRERGLYPLKTAQGKALNIDGDWGDATQAALEAFRRKNETDRQLNEASLGNLRSDLERQEGQVRGLEGGERLAESERNVSWPRWLLREVGPFVGMGLGGGGAMWARRRAVERAGEAARTTTAEANALIAGPFRGRNAPTERASAVNAFWQRGGAAEDVPFNMVQTRRGFERNPSVATPASLFPPEPRLYRAADRNVALGFGGEAALSGTGWYLAHQELREAHEAARADPSPVNIARLQMARDLVATAESLTRVGLTGVATTLGHAPFHPYPRDIRPNVRRAEEIAMQLNQLLARDRSRGGRRR